jgi:hypothetical protein
MGTFVDWTSPHSSQPSAELAERADTSHSFISKLEPGSMDRAAVSPELNAFHLAGAVVRIEVDGAIGVCEAAVRYISLGSLWIAKMGTNP